jgi:high-affinity iron transporter
VIANLLIGLREGLEAALVVSVLAAYVVKTGRRRLLSSIWLGVGIATAVALGFGALLTYGSQGLDNGAEEKIAGGLSILAVALVTWMIFWMASASRTLSHDLRARVDAHASSPWSLAVVAALAVGREGIETALFLWATTRSSGETGAGPIVGALIGIALAAGLGYALYAGAVRINLTKFFTVTGGALIVIAAGVLAYGVHELQEVGIFPGGDVMAFDISGAIPASGVLGTVLRGTLNFSPTPTVLQVGVWVAYVVVVGLFFARTLRRGSHGTKTPVTTDEADLHPVR